MVWNTLKEEILLLGYYVHLFKKQIPSSICWMVSQGRDDIIQHVLQMLFAFFTWHGFSLSVVYVWITAVSISNCLQWVSIVGSCTHCLAVAASLYAAVVVGLLLRVVNSQVLLIVIIDILIQLVIIIIVICKNFTSLRLDAMRKGHFALVSNQW